MSHIKKQGDEINMEIKEMKLLLQKNFEEMTKDVENLFEVEVDKDEMWNTYLENIPEKFNPVFRERRTHDCSSCRQFVKNIGNAVIIKDNEIKTIWDFETNSEGYQPAINAIRDFIKSKAITNIYVSKEKKIGTDFNFEDSNGKVLRWEHMFLELPDKFVNKSSKSIGDIKGGFRDTKNVFKRSLEEITQDAIETVLELINSNTLYKGSEWKTQLEKLLKYKKEYSKLKEEHKDNYCWAKSIEAGIAVGRIKNHSIGTLLVNISGGMELDSAVKKYEVIVAPSNYKRPKAIFTKKMLGEAKKTVSDLGYGDSLSRRFAKLDDITVNNILFSNKDTAKKMQGFDVFDEMEQDIAVDSKKFSKVEEISIDKFIEDVLPTAENLELLLENRHESNMVSLIAPEVKDSKIMMKWNNNFSWSYSGNITDSSMKDKVKSLGGKVDGDLRFSIQWNEEGLDVTDLDAHCKESNGSHIHYSDMYSRVTGGTLDVDIRRPNGTAVENIIWERKDEMVNGNYEMFVDDYSGNGTKRGFRAEVEFDGDIYSFDCPPFTSSKKKIKVATVTLKNGVFTIKEHLPSSTTSKEVWGVKTQQFVPVTIFMNSPNYWDEQQGIGHKHYFFMLKDCVSTELMNGFYNEFLDNKLTKHKRVFEALGSKLRVKDSDEQLSGVGFSSTKRNELTVKVEGKTTRVMKIKF